MDKADAARARDRPPSGVKVPAARLEGFSLPGRPGLPRLHPSFDDIEEIGFGDAQVAKPRPGVRNEPIKQQAIGGNLAFARPFELGVEAEARGGVKFRLASAKARPPAPPSPLIAMVPRQAEVERGVRHHIDEGRSGRRMRCSTRRCGARFRRSRSATIPAPDDAIMQPQVAHHLGRVVIGHGKQRLIVA